MAGIIRNLHRRRMEKKHGGLCIGNCAPIGSVREEKIALLRFGSGSVSTGVRVWWCIAVFFVFPKGEK